MTDDAMTGGRLQLPRTRGAFSGLALIVLGLWGGIVPFIGPYFDFAITPSPGDSWHWTAARGWYEVLPGAVALVGGLLVLVSANRALTSFGAWIAVAAGGWFVVGPQVSPLLDLGTVGTPANGGQSERITISLLYFAGLGAVIVLFAAMAAGRLSVHSVRDARVAARRDARERREEDERLAAERETERQQRLSEPRERHAASEQHAAVEDESGSERHAAPEEPTAEPRAEQPGAEPVSGSDQTAADAQASDSDTSGYATPQRYERSPDDSQQIPVEQIRHDHPTDGRDV